MKKQCTLINRRLEPGGRNTDRRVTPRYPVVNSRAFLAWKVGTENCESPARLCNISNGGALLFAEKRPMLGKTVWIRLGEPVTTDWAETQIVNIVKISGLLWFRKTSYLVRLRFTEHCPYQLFKSATHGAQLDSESPEPTLPEHDNRYRR